MVNIPTAIDVPLKADLHGTIRVGGTRVTLESVIADYKQGASPEKIADDFSVLQLADIYHVIGYYLAHQPEIEAYIHAQNERAAQIRQEWESKNPPPSKSELLYRKNAK